MKKVLFLLGALTLGLTSCDKNDVTEPIVTEVTIIGYNVTVLSAKDKQEITNFYTTDQFTPGQSTVDGLTVVRYEEVTIG